MNFDVLLPNFKDNVYNILDFGAVEGGIVSCGDAINKAIIECNKNGGGKVLIPRGLWLTSPIYFKSNVCLYLMEGAYVIFTKNQEDYPLYLGDWEGIKRLRATSPITAVDCENIAICGNGIIDGKGDLWRGIKRWKLTEKEWQARLKKSPYVMNLEGVDIWYPTESAYQGALSGETTDIEKATIHYDLYRPVLVSIIRCDKVLLDGVTFQNSPSWNIHPLFSSNITIKNCLIKNPYYAQNGDGLDVESCKNVHIYNNKFLVGDDGICIKSGKNKEARKIKVPCENVYIHDCDVFEAHGGFVVGSEMSRGVRNIIVENCNFIGTDVGIRFKSAIGRGGVVEDIKINNIRMTDIKGEAIIFTMGYALTTLGVAGVEELKKESEEDVPEFKNIDISNIVCLNAKLGLKIEGLSELPIHDIRFDNVKIICDNDIKLSNYDNISLKDVTFVTKDDTKYYSNELLKKESV